jgi:YHS domain-containing protein
MFVEGLDGLDPLLLREHLQKTPGDPQFRSKYKGRIYLFARAAHRDAFKRSPEHYLPKFDGCCAFTFAVFGSEVPGSPAHALVVSGRLYLFSNQAYVSLWQCMPFLASWASMRKHQTCARLASI